MRSLQSEFEIFLITLSEFTTHCLRLVNIISIITVGIQPAEKGEIRVKSTAEALKPRESD